MSVQRPETREEQDEAYSPYNPDNLANAERKLPGIMPLHAVGHTPTAPSQTANGATKNIDAADKQERQPSLNRDFINNFTGKSNGKKRFGGKKLIFSKGPTGLIATAVVGGGIGIGGILTPGAALVHIKEVIAGKIDSLTSVNEARGYVGLKSRMFSTTGACKIKVRCRFSGLTKTQMDRLTKEGAQLLDKDGKPVQARKIAGITRYSGGRTLVFPDPNGRITHRITASNYNKSMRTIPALRDLSRKVYAPKYVSLGPGKIMKFVRDKFKLTTDQKWGADGDEKEARKAIHESQTGENQGGAEVQDNAERDKDGKPIDKTGTEIEGLNGAVEGLEDETNKIQAQAAAGEPVPPLPSDPAAVAMMDDPPVKTSFKGVFNKVVGAANPLGLVAGMCTVYQVAYAMVLAAKTIAMTHAMRYAASILSTLDKVKYGVATSDEVEKVMKIFQRPDQFGNEFGDAVGYQFPAYGTVPSLGITSSAAGNETIRMLTAVLGYIDTTVPGGGAFVRTTCKILTNPFVQGGLALTSFIPGASQAVKGITGAVGRATKIVAERQIKNEIKKIIEKQAAKASASTLKSVAKSATRGLWKMAKSPPGIFLASYLIGKYAVPWGARMLADAEFTGNENGVQAIDATMNGLHGTINGAGQEGGMAPLTKDEYKQEFKAFNDSSRATYIADMRADSNPFDLNDPYSAGNSLASSLYMFSSKLNFQDGTTNILSLPATILSSLSPSTLLSKTASADDVDVDSTFCKDDPYLDKHNLASMPDCQAIYGFNNPTMLTNTTDKQVVEWMLNKKQIDDDGQPAAGSAFEDFEKKCVTNTSGKIISDLGDETQRLDPECYGDKNKTYDWQMYRLYNFDSNMDQDMNMPLTNTDKDAAPSPDEGLDDAAFYEPADTHETSTVSAVQPQALPSLACNNQSPHTLVSSYIPGVSPTVPTNAKKWELTYAA